MGLDTVGAFLVGLLLLVLLGRVLFIPLRFIVRLLFNAAVGGVLLWLANLIGRHIGVSIPINPITALLAGFLGVPGVVLVVAVQYFITHGTL
ncbi:MAG: pro-sigmaK processing inhibitor BofA family protein [Bacillota bacterium]|nr:pro-sigmaK processing inhibitor BofA family protein [Bacillota bacterium]